MLGLKGSKPGLKGFRLSLKIDFKGPKPDLIDLGSSKTRFWRLRGFGYLKPGLGHFQLGLGSFKPLLKAANQAFGP